MVKLLVDFGRKKHAELFQRRLQEPSTEAPRVPQGLRTRLEPSPVTVPDDLTDDDEVQLREDSLSSLSSLGSVDDVDNYF